MNRRVTSQAFRALAALGKTDNLNVCKYSTVKAEKESGDTQALSFVLSDESIDREGDVIRAAGWKLDQYEKNPVVLWAHNYGGPPVARGVGVKTKGKRLVGKAEFITDGDSELHKFAKAIYQLYRDGFMSAVSVGFNPLKWDQRKNKSGDVEGIEFTEQELLEFSLVPVPANANALIVARKSGIDTDPLIDFYRQADLEISDELKRLERFRKRYFWIPADFGVAEKKQDNEILLPDVPSTISVDRAIEELSISPDTTEDVASQLGEKEQLDKGEAMSSKETNQEIEDKRVDDASAKEALAIHHTSTTEASWDAGLNVRRLREGENPQYYVSAFAWVDPEADPTTKGAYKFPNHMVAEDGTVGAANTRACSAGIGVLNGARGGADIPDADRQGVYDHLAAHLIDADMEPPELRSVDDAGKEAARWTELGWTPHDAEKWLRNFVELEQEPEEPDAGTKESVDVIEPVEVESETKEQPAEDNTSQTDVTNTEDVVKRLIADGTVASIVREVTNQEIARMRGRV